MRNIRSIAWWRYLSVPVLGLALTACPAQKIACQAIKTADDACVLINMVGVDGGAQSVQVSGQELREFATQKFSEREAAKWDGGVK